MFGSIFGDLLLTILRPHGATTLLTACRSHMLTNMWHPEHQPKTHASVFWLFVHLATFDFGHDTLVLTDLPTVTIHKSPTATPLTFILACSLTLTPALTFDFSSNTNAKTQDHVH